MTAFWMALLFVLMAEMGDKTQLVALAFATHFPTGTVLTGVCGATLVVHLFSVSLGEAAGIALPVFWLHLLAGLSFIVFGLWTLRGDTLAEEAHTLQAHFGPLLTVGMVVADGLAIIVGKVLGKRLRTVGPAASFSRNEGGYASGLTAL